ncbi:MAG: diacylglycerol kinase family protein [Anaerolineales bacterium]
MGNFISDFVYSRLQSFRHAFAGWGFVLRTQRNAWIHALASVCVILVSLWLRISLVDWAIILIAITIVWTAEFLNTALEAVADLASNGKQNRLAKVGKDVGAAAVLIAALSSILIGILILAPPLIERLGR